MWLGGIDKWTEIYSDRVQTWFEAIEEAEAETGVDLKNMQLPMPLSTYMRQSWDTGRFWLSYAARRGWAFDVIYRKYLDERFFGERRTGVSKELWKTRVHGSSDSDRENGSGALCPEQVENRRKEYWWIIGTRKSAQTLCRGTI